MGKILEFKKSNGFYSPIPLEEIWENTHRVGLETLFKKEKKEAKIGDLILIEKHINKNFVNKIVGVVYAEKSGVVYFHHGVAGVNNYVVLNHLPIEKILIEHNNKIYKVETRDFGSPSNENEIQIGSFHTIFLVPYK